MKRPFARFGDLPAVGLGAMPLSVPPRPAAAAARSLVHLALDLGVTLIDTADVYCRDDADLGHNERLLAAALADHPRRREVLVATKGGLRRPGGDWVEDGRPDALRRACEASVRALGVERIALYQLHAPDPAVPFADSVGELFRLRDEGKVGEVGLSNVTVAELDEALALGPVVSVQNRLNPLDLTAMDVVTACERRGVTFLAYSPVGGAEQLEDVLTHPQLVAAAAAHAVGPGTVSLAWLLGLSPAIFVIPGARREASLRASVAAGTIALQPAWVSALDEAFGHARPA
jgi:aryl-alcohol dehydrogenase-like predicted oxidoreductase